MKVLSLFSGIGAFEKALDNLEIPYELAGFCEIDKYASASYSAIHNISESMNLGDITKIDEKALPKDIDLITYGFPCQDISLAGKQKGFLQCEECNTSNPIPENYVKRLKDGEKFYCEKCGAELKQTRSGLFFEALRIIEEVHPCVAIAENVKNLTSKKFKDQFNIVLDSLEATGYNNYWAVLNAKNFGVPQNRERVFIVSIRKDIDTGTFKFPEGFPLDIRLKDVLEDNVDEKYYLKDTKDYFIKHSFESERKGNGFRFEPHIKSNADIAKAITTKAGSRMDDNFVMDIDCEMPKFKFDSKNPFLVIDGDKVFVREATKKGVSIAVEGDSINMDYPNSKTRRGRVGKQIAQTMTTSCNQGVVIYDDFNRRIKVDQTTIGAITTNIGKSAKGNGTKIIEVSGNKIRIRKFTPSECFRLFGFSQIDCLKCIEAGVTETQIYKQAGNSIVVPVIEYIIQALLDCGALTK